MPQIGTFMRTSTGFAGRIRTLSFDTEFAILPAEPTDAENAPDYRVHLGDADGPEVGAGWTRTGERAGEFVAIVLDDPVFDGRVPGEDYEGFVDAHVRRLEALRRAGIAERIDADQWRIPDDFEARAAAHDAGRNTRANIRILSTLDLERQIGSDGAT